MCPPDQLKHQNVRNFPKLQSSFSYKLKALQVFFLNFSPSVFLVQFQFCQFNIFSPPSPSPVQSRAFPVCRLTVGQFPTRSAQSTLPTPSPSQLHASNIHNTTLNFLHCTVCAAPFTPPLFSQGLHLERKIQCQGVRRKGSGLHWAAQDPALDKS